MRIFLFICLLPLSAQSSLKNLTSEFLQKNTQIKTYKANFDLATLNHQLITDQRVLGMEYKGTLSNNNLDSNSVFNNQNVKYTAHELGFSKGFNWGGTLGFTNSLEKTDRSKWNTTLLGSTPVNTYEFSQTLSYSQNLGKNFFGRDHYREIDESFHSMEMNKLLSKYQTQEKLIEFYGTYLNAWEKKELLRINDEALKRAIRRVKLIRKRVRDGLSLKAENYIATNLELQAKEDHDLARNNLTEALNNLSILVHRNVNIREILNLAPKSILRPAQGYSNNYRVQMMENKKEMNIASIDRAEYGYWPDLSLAASYTTNAVDAKQSEAFSDGTLDGDKDETAFVLSLSYPLDLSLQKTALAKSKVSAMLTDLELKNLKTNLTYTERSIKERLSLIASNVESAKKRVEVLKKAIDSFERLYKLGRVNIDRLLDQEDALSSAERVLISFIKSEQMILANQALLASSVDKFLMK